MDEPKPLSKVAKKALRKMVKSLQDFRESLADAQVAAEATPRPDLLRAVQYAEYLAGAVQFQPALQTAEKTLRDDAR